MIFKLKLSREIISVYPVFHTVLFKLVPENISLAKIIDIERYKNQDYKIKRILAKNKINRVNH